MRIKLVGQRGASLLGALILGITIVAIGASLFQVFLVQSKWNKAIESQINAAMLMGSLRTILYDPPLCMAALGGQSAALNAQLKIRNVVAIDGYIDTLEQGTTKFGQNLQVGNVWFVKPVSTPSCANPTACAFNRAPCAQPICPNDQILTLEVQFTQPSQNAGGNSHAFHIPVQMTVDPVSKNITACHSMGVYRYIDYSKTPPVSVVTLESNYDVCNGIGGVWGANACHMAPGTPSTSDLVPAAGLVVPANSTTSASTNPTTQYSACGLSEMLAGGAAATESCTVTDMSGGAFKLSGTEVANPAETCSASCLQGPYGG